MSEREFSAHCADELDAMIRAEGPDTVAAFIAEPVLGTGGIVPPPDGYWEAIGPVLERHDVLLIADEVVTGFGRLGTMFGADRYGMRPDLITIAKGLTSAYAPLSGSIVSERMWKVLEEGTDRFGADRPRLDVLGAPDRRGRRRREPEARRRDGGSSATRGRSARPCSGRCGTRSRTTRTSARCAARACCARSSSSRIATTRRFFDPTRKVGPAVVAAMLKRGVIARAMPEGDILGFAPPLCLSEDEAALIVEATVEAVAEVLG